MRVSIFGSVLTNPSSASDIDYAYSGCTADAAEAAVREWAEGQGLDLPLDGHEAKIVAVHGAPSVPAVEADDRIVSITGEVLERHIPKTLSRAVRYYGRHDSWPADDEGFRWEVRIDEGDEDDSYAGDGVKGLRRALAKAPDVAADWADWADMQALLRGGVGFSRSFLRTQPACQLGGYAQVHVDVRNRRFSTPYAAMATVADNQWRLVEFVLGAPDPEMSAIEDLLASLCCARRYAVTHRCAVVTPADRVHPGNAYRALLGPRRCGYEREEAALDRVRYWVECAPAEPGPLDRFVDHHRPGDSGFGRPPEEAIEASSLGQVAAVLGVALNEEQRITAAMDHCLAAAAAGRVPNIEADSVIERLRRPHSLRDMLQAAAALGRAEMRAGLAAVIDNPPNERGERDQGPHPALRVAALALGVAYEVTITTRKSDPNGAYKRVVAGGGEGSIPGVEPIALWMKRARAGDFPEIDPDTVYGDAVRGFAGAYIRD